MSNFDQFGVRPGGEPIIWYHSETGQWYADGTGVPETDVHLFLLDQGIPYPEALDLLNELKAG